MNTNEPVSYACQIVEADFEANILKIEMLDEDYSVSAGIKFLSNTHPAKELTQNIMDIYRLSDQSIQIVFTSCRSASEFEAILRKAQEK